MPDRATLARLGKLVTADVVAGQPGLNSWAVSEFLERNPESVLDLVEMLVAEGRKKRRSEKLISAYVYMIGQSLEFVRYAIEQGHTPATELADAVRRTLLDLGKSKQIEPSLLLLILGEFSTAKLDPGAELRSLMATLMEQAATTAGAGGRAEDFDSYVADVAKSVSGDPFAFHAHMQEMVEALPEEHRIAMAASLLGSREAPVREAVIGWLFDSSAEVRNAVASIIEQAAAQGAASGTMLRRLITMRNWLPETSRPALDRAIQACRRKDVVCAPWPQPQVREVFASGVDGVGAQSVFVLAREGRRNGIGCLLIKHGIGVRDAWGRHSLARAEAQEFLEQVAGGIDMIPITLDYVRIAAAHSLAVNLASGVLPPFAMLDFAEIAGLQELQPEATSVDRILGMLEAAIDPADLRPEIQSDILVSSGDLPEEFGFLDSWFEDDADVERLLEGKRMARAKRVALILDTFLPKHAAKWAEKLAWTALTLQHGEDEEPWEEFFLSAKAIIAGRPMTEIPLMVHVANLTVDAYLARHRTGGAWRDG